MKRYKFKRQNYLWLRAGAKFDTRDPEIRVLEILTTVWTSLHHIGVKADLTDHSAWMTINNLIFKQKVLYQFDTNAELPTTQQKKKHMLVRLA